MEKSVWVIRIKTRAEGNHGVDSPFVLTSSHPIGRNNFINTFLLSMPSSKALRESEVCLSDSQLLLEIEPVGDISITSEARVSEVIADLNALVAASHQSYQTVR